MGKAPIAQDLQSPYSGSTVFQPVWSDTQAVETSNAVYVDFILSAIKVSQRLCMHPAVPRHSRTQCCSQPERSPRMTATPTPPPSGLRSRKDKALGLP